MQEFSSVTASSYDADSLAPLLTEKSAEGWTVVSIVTAGTNIVAYLERESDGSVTEVAPAAEDTFEATADTATDTQTDGAAAAAATGAVLAADEPAGAGDVDEPAGWAVAPEETATDTGAEETATDESLADLVADVEAADTAEASPTLSDTAAETPAAAEPAAAAATPAAEAPAEAPPAESTVPAGWYADPAGRFELRYWDGSAWTEHVSRAGQQFTDPPVA